MKHSIIVWDFNGTIVDDVAAGIASVDPLLAARGLKRIESVARYKQAFRFPIREYYAELGFDFEREPYETIAREWVENYKRLEPDIGLVDGVLEPIEYFYKLGLTQVVLSASESSMLKSKLDSLGIRKYFSELVSLDNIYAHSKLDIALEYFKDKNKRDCIMIGDTLHDAEVAREVGVDAVLIACGHHDRKRLEQAGYPVYDDMHSLMQKIEDRGI